VIIFLFHSNFFPSKIQFLGGFCFYERHCLDLIEATLFKEFWKQVNLQTVIAFEA